MYVCMHVCICMRMCTRMCMCSCACALLCVYTHAMFAMFVVCWYVFARAAKQIVSETCLNGIKWVSIPVAGSFIGPVYGVYLIRGESQTAAICDLFCIT